LAMLLAMLIHWLTIGKPIYPSEQEGQTIAYISDVGAFEFKPLFITMGTISVVLFDIAFIAERWLRHSGRLVHNTTKGQKALAVLSIFFALVGAAGLILLSIFDTNNHPRLHDVFLALFIGGYVISAVFTCAEYQRLGKIHRQFRVLRASFWVKLAFIIIELALAIAFGTLNKLKHWNTAAVVEWVIALLYSTYVLSFVMDFIPAVKTKHHPGGHGQMHEEAAFAHSGVAQDDTLNRYGNGYGHNDAAYPSGTSMGGMSMNRHSENGHAPRQPGAIV